MNKIDKNRTLPQSLLKNDEYIALSSAKNKGSSGQIPYDDKEFQAMEKIIHSINDVDYAILCFKEGQYTLLLIPITEITFVNFESLKLKVEILLMAPAIYATITFGKKFMDYFYEVMNYIFDFETIDTLIKACIPFGKIIEDNFADVEINLREEEKALKGITTNYTSTENNVLPQSKKIVQLPLEEINFQIRVL